MKILHVIPSVSVSYGGPVVTMSNFIKIWSLTGTQSAVLTLMTDSSAVKTIGTEVHEVPSSFPKRFSNSRMAEAWFRAHKNDFDLVMFHSIWSLINLRVARVCRHVGRKYVIIPHGSLDPFDLQKKAILKRVFGPLVISKYIDGAQGLICSTELEAHRLETYGARTRRFVIPWPVEKEVFPVDRVSARKSLGWNLDDFIVLFLGRVDYKKGFPVLIPAIKQLVERGVRCRLVIAGPDSRGYLGTVRQMIENHKISDFVSFQSTVVGADKSRVMFAADCFCLPSLNENFGNAVVEALQHSLPVVISDNVYIANLVSAAAAGFVCRYDVSDTAAALERLAIEPEKRLQMRLNAAALGDEFLPEKLAARYADIIEQVTISK